MKYVIYGAGGVGGVIGAKLFEAGLDVTLIARGEHARCLQQQGLNFVDDSGTRQLAIPTVAHPQEIPWLSDPQVAATVLCCMKSQHMADALTTLAQCGHSELNIACVQNGVANEALALRYFANVYATLVNLPATFITPGEVICHAVGKAGILDTGRYPAGVDQGCTQFTADLRQAGFSAEPAARVMRQKYAKLLMNLANVLQAALSPEEDLAPVMRGLRQEALACYAAAGIDCASKAEVSARAKGVYQLGGGAERLAGSSWQSMARGTGDIETEFLNGEICLLGRLHGIATPLNDACVQLARRMLREARGPRTYVLTDVPEFAALVQGAATEI